MHTFGEHANSLNRGREQLQSFSHPAIHVQTTISNVNTIRPLAADSLTCHSKKKSVTDNLMTALFYSSISVRHDSEPVYTVPGP